MSWLRLVPVAAMELGAYHRNQLFIVVGDDVELVDANDVKTDSLSTDQMAVFFHEYLHFLHNFSTIAGFESFSVWQYLLARFSETVDEHGRSGGNTKLGQAQLAEVREFIRLWCWTCGDVTPSGARWEHAQSLRITAIREEDETFRLHGEDVRRRRPVLDCRVTLRDGTNEDIGISLGTAMIEEGIAYEVDRLVAAGPRGGGSQDNAPIFPYFVLRQLGLSLCDPLEQVTLAYCGVLALNRPDPGCALVSMLRDLNEDRKTKSLTDALLTQKTATQRVLAAVCKTIREERLPGLASLHEQRGLAEQAFEELSRLFGRLLSKREIEPAFELIPFSENKVDLPLLHGLLSTNLPCDVLQQGTGSPDCVGRDKLLSFSAASAAPEDYSPTDKLRPFHAQLHHMLMHLRTTGFIATADVGPEQCPYYTTCDCELRRNDPERCRTRPWETYSPTADKTCWYGAGVAQTVGTLVVTAIERP